jgi:Tol biopolymer transport system component
LKSAVVVACLTTLAVLCSPAQGAFSGLNGKIAFQSNRDGNFEIYSMNADGSDQTRLTTNAAEDVNAAWSPDGTKIAFQSNRDGNAEIYVMSADGMNQTRLTTNSAEDLNPAWSPDGTKLAFQSNRDGNVEIYSMNSDGTTVTRLTTNAAIDGQPAWSADGTRIAFASNRDGNFEIYMMTPNGTVVGRVTPLNPNDESEPNWAPDSDRIAFQYEFPGTSEVASCAVGVGCYRQFTPLVAGELEGMPSYSPDKTKAVYGYRPSGGNWDIVSVLNDGSESSPVTPLTTNPASDQAPDWQPVARNYARPKSAGQIKLALVPAHTQCIEPRTNASHKAFLERDSCNPPLPASEYLTLGTPDFNGAPANGVGSLILRPFCNGGAPGEGPPCSTTPGDQLDASIAISQTDVRCQGTSGGCLNGAMSDYTGSLRLNFIARITDRNSSGATGAATVPDLDLHIDFSCTTTPATTQGSTCSTTTSFDALTGAAGITEGKRAIFELGEVLVFDGGSDGDAERGTATDDTLFLTDGLFFP